MVIKNTALRLQMLEMSLNENILRFFLRLGYSAFGRQRDVLLFLVLFNIEVLAEENISSPIRQANVDFYIKVDYLRKNESFCFIQHEHICTFEILLLLSLIMRHTRLPWKFSLAGTSIRAIYSTIFVVVDCVSLFSHLTRKGQNTQCLDRVNAFLSEIRNSVDFQLQQ